MALTGLPLEWLVDELEKCPAKEKLLLLDGGRGGGDLAGAVGGGDAPHAPGIARPIAHCARLRSSPVARPASEAPIGPKNAMGCSRGW